MIWQVVVAVGLFLAVAGLWRNQVDLARLLAKKADHKEVNDAREAAFKRVDYSDEQMRLLANQDSVRYKEWVDQAEKRARDEARAGVARLEETKTPRPRTEMDDQEKILMRQNWEALVCQHCGWAHPGVCPRVKENRTESMTAPGGKVLQVIAVTEFWPNDQWEPPEGAIHPSDVWGTPVASPAEIEAAAGEAASG